jgi:hypothetical protein
MKDTGTHAKPVEKPRFDRMQEEYFELVKRFETPVLRTTARVAPRVAQYVPKRPAFMEPLPKMTEVVERGLAFRKRFVDEQAKFVRSMIKAFDPMIVKFDGGHAKAEPIKRPVPPRPTAVRPVARRGARAA